MQRVTASLVLLFAMAFAAAPLFGPGFSGFDTSDMPVTVTDPPFQPAAWAFSIWGLIYAALVAMAVFGLWKRQEDPAWAVTRVPIILSMALGTFWLFVAKTAPVAATMMLWVMLASALAALFAAAPSSDRWALRAPLAIYAGWLTAASGVATGSVVAGYGLLSPLPTTLLVVLLVVAIGLVVQLRLSDTPEHAGAVIWALTGIVASNIPGDVVVSAVAVLAIAIMAMAALRAI